MKIHKLQLQNFRCFKDETFTFSDQFTVLVGDNGAGKSAILDALAFGLQVFLPETFNGAGKRSISIEDVRHKFFGKAVTTFEKQFPSKLHYQAKVNKKSLRWSNEMLSDGPFNALAYGPVPIEEPTILEFVKALHQQVRQGQEVHLPLIAYYGSNRVSSTKTQLFDAPYTGSRLDGYLNCLNSVIDNAGMVAWIKRFEAVANERKLQGKSSLLILDAIKEAIANCMEKWRNIRYDFSEDALLAIADSGEYLPFHLLSEGQRNILGMVADIARRAAILNGDLENNLLKETSGIVLIDEIDLHLHPKWQRRVVEDLRQTFPKIQFIMTTHSPFIIQSLQPGELINLNKGEPAEYTNESIEDITENVMGVPLPQQSQRYEEMVAAAKKYYDILEQGQSASPQERERLKQRLDELSAPYRDDAAYQAFLEIKREQAGMGKNGA
jgi:predicted ATP-binding protein involved in virulence